MTLPIAMLFLQVLLIPTSSSSTVPAITLTAEPDTSTKPDLIATTVSPSTEAAEPLPIFGSQSSAELPSVPDEPSKDVVATPVCFSGPRPLSNSQLHDQSEKLRRRE